MNTIQDVLFAMIQYDSGDPARIQHFLKVHAFARIIGLAEGLDTASLFILEAAAIIHDIGIQNALKTYGRCDGPLQEKLGPPEAEKTATCLRPDGTGNTACKLVVCTSPHISSY